MPGQGNRIDFVTGAPEKYARLVDGLSIVPNQYRDAVGRVSDAVMRQEPSDSWSLQRILAHVVFVTEANDVFIHQMATMTEPVRKEFPMGFEAIDLKPLSADELLQHIEDALGRTVALLSGTPDAAWGRPGYIGGQRRSLKQVVEGHIAHFDEHLTEMRRMLGVPATR